MLKSVPIKQMEEHRSSWLRFATIAQHGRERLAGGGAGVYQLLDRARVTPRSLSSWTMSCRSFMKRKPVDAGNHQDIFRLYEGEQHLKLSQVVAPAAAGFLRAHQATASGLERGALDGEILIETADASVAEDRHG